MAIESSLLATSHFKLSGLLSYSQLSMDSQREFAFLEATKAEFLTAETSLNNFNTTGCSGSLEFVVLPSSEINNNMV